MSDIDEKFTMGIRTRYLEFIREVFSLTFLQMLLLLKESGITTWHLRDIIRKRDSYNLREVLVEHDGYDGSVQVLGLTPLGAGFSMLVVGFSIATVVFYLELKRAAGSIQINKILTNMLQRCNNYSYQLS